VNENESCHRSLPTRASAYRTLPKTGAFKASVAVAKCHKPKDHGGTRAFTALATADGLLSSEWALPPPQFENVPPDGRDNWLFG
jgi:hypothetical protein